MAYCHPGGWNTANILETDLNDEFVMSLWFKKAKYLIISTKTFWNEFFLFPFFRTRSFVLLWWTSGVRICIVYRFNLLTLIHLDLILQHGKLERDRLWPMTIKIFWMNFKWIDQTTKTVYFTNNFSLFHYCWITWQWNYHVK